MGLANGFGPGFGQAEMLDLSGPDQVAHRARNILDRHGRIDAVLIKQIDPVSPQPLEAGIHHFADMFRPAIGARALRRIGLQVETELGGDNYRIAQRFKRFAQQVFVGERAIDFGGVKEGHPALHRAAQQGDHLSLVRRGAIGPGHAHAAKAKRGNRQARTA